MLGWHESCEYILTSVTEQENGKLSFFTNVFSQGHSHLVLLQISLMWSINFPDTWVKEKTHREVKSETVGYWAVTEVIIHSQMYNNAIVWHN